jgi:hypothetical protein
VVFHHDTIHRIELLSRGGNMSFRREVFDLVDGFQTGVGRTAESLPLGVARGVADLFRGDPAGLGRAGSIIAGLAVTCVGYLTTKTGRARQQ